MLTVSPKVKDYLLRKTLFYMYIIYLLSILLSSDPSAYFSSLLIFELPLGLQKEVTHYST